jgi:tRNA-splicing ligase RtcB
MASGIPPSALQRLDPYRVRVARFRQDMLGEGLAYASDALWPAILADETLGQLVNVAALPGLVGRALLMPDGHQGYGFPIGGVAATDPKRGGVISPGGVGFDIQCGVRLLSVDVEAAALRERMALLLDALLARIPVGGAREGGHPVGPRGLEALLVEGAAWAVREGLGVARDLEHVEDGGRFVGADPGALSPRALERGRLQLGTLGSGNHFLEFQEIAAIGDAELARAFGLRRGGAAVMFHTGSRGLGHQVCTDHLAALQKAMGRHGVTLPDRQLAAVPLDSDEGRAYYAAMGAAANYAWANRQVLTARVREALLQVLGPATRVDLVYDVAHNVAREEEHAVEGRPRRLLVHRKGATRAFPAHHPLLPRWCRDFGHPVFVPGSMGTCSYVLVGTETALAETWGSVCHGAGRAMSRGAAKRSTTAARVRGQLEARGVLTRGVGGEGLVEEAPEAYKDVSAVVDTLVGADLARIVAVLRPMGVLKG